MGNCLYCEGSYLPPNKRNRPNIKYSIHEACLWEMVRANREVEATIKFLKQDYNRIEFQDALNRIQDFHARMEKIRKRRILTPIARAHASLSS